MLDYVMALSCRQQTIVYIHCVIYSSIVIPSPASGNIIRHTALVIKVEDNFAVVSTQLIFLFNCAFECK